MKRILIGLSDLRGHLIRDIKRTHEKELARATKGGYTVLSNMVMEFGGSKTIKLFDKYESQETANKEKKKQ